MSLEPLRQTYLRRAKSAAEAAIALARQEATSTLAAAHQEAESILEAAGNEGRSTADHQTRRERSVAGKEARSALLAARRDAYQSLQRLALRRVRAIRDRPQYQELLGRLEAQARRQLGHDASIDVDPADVGGVTAASGRRCVDYTLPALVERSLADLGEEVESLWR